ncbi:MAG: DUF6520 family protein [Cyclobacteriaceae bacterium]
MKKIRIVMSVLALVIAGVGATASQLLMQNPVYEWIESEETCQSVPVNCELTGTQACQFVANGPVYRENDDIENQCGRTLRRTP